jgi:hypothetical protein
LETSAQIAYDTLSAFNELEFDDLMERLKKVIERVEDLGRKIHDASRAMGELEGGGTAKGGGTATGGGSSGQTGIWRVPSTSTWTLHAGETVLPPAVAESWRNLMDSISRVGISGAPNIPAFAMAAATNAAAAPESTSRLGVRDINIYANISDDFGFQKFKTKFDEALRQTGVK